MVLKHLKICKDAVTAEDFAVTAFSVFIGHFVEQLEEQPDKEGKKDKLQNVRT